MKKRKAEVLLPEAQEPGLTAEQKELRKRGIGASEIAAVAGLSPWQGPLDIYLLKTGQMETADNENMERGRYLEDGLRRWFVRRTGLAVRRGETTFHPDHPFILATPDGIVLDAVGRDDGVLELKAPQGTAEHWGEEGTSDIPAYYIPQVMQEMACAGLDKAHVGAMLWGRLRLYVVRFDVELFEGLVQIASDFWENNVLKRVPPDPAGSRLAAEWLAKKYPVVKEKDLVVSTAEIDDTMLELARLREAQKRLEQEEAGLRARLMAGIGSHQGVVGQWGKILWSQTKGKKSTNWQAIALGLGATEADIKRHTKEGQDYRQLRTYFKGVAP